MAESLISAEEKDKKETLSNCKYDMEEVIKSDNNCPTVLEK